MDEQEAKHTPGDAVGQFAVIRGSWSDYAVVGPVSKVTAQRLYHPDKYGGQRETFSDLSTVLLVTDQASCRALQEKLTSSKALSKEEVMAANARHAKREADLIEKATNNG